MQKKVTIEEIKRKKELKEKILMLTASNYPFAKILDEAGVDIILVGDSLGMTELGYESTLPVTMDEMIHHAKAVRRATSRAMVIVDMPFMSYQVSHEEAIRNAGRIIKEALCDGVKIEGGEEVAEIIHRLTTIGIPVMSHIGLTPQKALTLSGYKVQGKDHEDAQRIRKQAKLLEEAGAFSIVLECIPQLLAKEITELVQIPTIGIGAGKYCDGQVLVTYDLIGLFDRFTPKFVKRYANIKEIIIKAVRDFTNEVKSEQFPDNSHSF